MNQTNRVCIEFVSFRLKKDIEVETFLTASRRFDAEFLKNEPGFIERRLVRMDVDADGSTWADLALWENAAAAKRVEAKFMQDPVSAAYGSFIDANSVRMEHFSELSVFAPGA